MSTESLNRTSGVDNDPSPQVINTKVNIGVLKQRLIDQKKKRESEKNYYIFKRVCFFMGFNNSFFLKLNFIQQI